jgi:hypothetical protein
LLTLGERNACFSFHFLLNVVLGMSVDDSKECEFSCAAWLIGMKSTKEGSVCERVTGHRSRRDKSEAFFLWGVAKERVGGG